MKTQIPYGQGFEEVEIPPGNIVNVFTPKKPKTSASFNTVKQKIKQMVKEYAGMIEKSNGDICVLVSDKTRAASNSIIVPELLRQLESVGTNMGRLRIIIANGLHTPMTRQEIVENIGREVVDRFTIINHISDEEDRHVFIGRTRFGTEVKLNRKYVDAKLKIATGLVEPHFFAGFSGGYKSVLPGIASTKTVYHNHSFEMIDHPNSKAGILEGNPIHEDIKAAGRLSGLNLIINVTVSSSKPSSIHAGEVEKVYKEAVEKVRSEACIKVDHLYDVIITSNGGFPLDRNLYQAVKGISVGESIVKKKGSIIVLSECRDGVVHEEFKRLMEYGETPKDILSSIKENEPLRDQWQAHVLARIMLRSKVIVVSHSLNRKDVEKMKMDKVNTLDEALELAKVKENGGKSIAIFPNGPYTIPVI
ncbi:MAG: nickel-dependent lactate racemase [Nitrososphaeria archaeon]